MATETWPVKRLRVLIKGGQSSDGGGGGKITNAEIEDILDKMSDDHEPGNEAGEKSDIPDDAKDDGGKSGGEIDQNGKNIDDQIQEGGENAQKEEAKEGPKEVKQPAKKDQKPTTGTREHGGSNSKVDYTNVKPRFNWKELVQRFVKSKLPKPEESYAKPARKSVTSMHIAGQVGAAAIKPGEKMGEIVDLKLCFALDCSGSMIPSIGRMFAEANALLKDPRFKNSEVYVVKMGSVHEVWRGIFAQNKAARINSVNDNLSPTYSAKMNDVFAKAEGGGTEITDASAAEILALLKRGYNVLLLTDTDILWDHNIKLVMNLLKMHGNQMFIVMRDRTSYITWREKTGIATANITYFA